MDLSIIYAIGTLIILVGVAFGIRFATKKGYVKEADLEFVIGLFDLTMAIVDELDLKNEQEIKRIAEYVKLGLDYAREVAEGGSLDSVVEYTIELCQKNDIEINEQREKIIRQLAMIGLNKVLTK